jgi:hypothetical protein
MIATITLTVSGSDTGPFNLYSNVDGFVTPFETGISRNDLINGYTSVLVPDFTTTLRIQSTGVCTNYIDIPVTLTTTTSTSTSSTSTTSTTTTTEAPIYYYLLMIYGCETCVWESFAEYYSTVPRIVGNFYTRYDGYFTYQVAAEISGPGPVFDMSDMVEYGTDCLEVPCSTTTTTTTTVEPSTTTTTTTTLP